MASSKCADEWRFLYQWLNTSMRFFEFETIKPTKPLNPAQARIAALKRNVEQGRAALKRERETQRMQKEREAQRKAQQRPTG
jgi:hypothetical protein